MCARTIFHNLNWVLFPLASSLSFASFFHFEQEYHNLYYSNPSFHKQNCSITLIPSREMKLWFYGCFLREQSILVIQLIPCSSIGKCCYSHSVLTELCEWNITSMSETTLNKMEGLSLFIFYTWVFNPSFSQMH